VRRPATNEAPPAIAVADDPVGAVIPMLKGMPKVKQLEILKGMMLLPDNKLMFQIPDLADARATPLAERVALSREIGTQLIGALEDEGLRYDLPADYVPVGAAIAPPPESQSRP
jgi:hypothetical protein